MKLPSVIELSGLNGSNGGGFQINGVAIGDKSGFSVASAGDVNGDGFDDLIIGAKEADPHGSNSGASYVVFGKASGFAANLDLSTLNGSNGFKISGELAGDWSGFSVASAGDVNGDGIDDLIIGAKEADPSPNGIDTIDRAGASYVVFGTKSGFAANLDLSNLNGSNGFQINGELATDQSGWSVASAGDFNGDGFDDLIIGAPGADPAGGYSGASYLVFGKASGFAPNLNLSTLGGSNGFQINGETFNNNSGASVASAGDVNGDGFADLIIGAPLSDLNGGNSGTTYVVFGNASGSVPALAQLNGLNGFRIRGEAAGDRSGYSVASAGDVNGDGFADLIIGASLADPNGSGSGASYVVFGKASGFAANLDLSTLNGSNGFQISGELAGDQSGFSVASAGDFNGDGFDDLIIGARNAHPNGLVAAGASYVVLGKASPFAANLDLSTLNGSNGFQINGENVADYSGFSVASAGDVNGDGFDDLIIGAYGADPNGLASGASYVVFGKASNHPDTVTKTAATVEVQPIQITLSGSDTDGTVSSFKITTTLAHGGLFLDQSGTTPVDPNNIPASGNQATVWFKAAAGFHGSTSFQYAAVDNEGQQDLSPATFTLTVTHPILAPVIDLSSLNGSNGFQIKGEAAFDLNGFSVASAGDVNGDGFDDVIIGAPGASPHGLYSGASYVVFGKASGFTGTLDLSTLTGSNGGGFQINGEAAYDGSGASVASAGDVNGDGIGDLIIGAPGDNLAPLNSPGASYVVFGKATGFGANLDLSTLTGSNGGGFQISGEAGDHSGYSVASAGDVNGDGIDDLIIGSSSFANPALPGASYVVFGKTSGFNANLDVSTLTGSNGFKISGVAADDRTGISVASAGDVNGDGIDDLIIGAPGADPHGNSSGASYVVFGTKLGFGANIDLSTLNGTTGFKISGEAADDHSGRSVASAGDVNGDGIDDLIIGAPGAGPGYSGASYVVFGKATGFGANLDLSTLTGSNGGGFQISAAAQGDNLGYSVASAGDVNGDGFDDLIIGAYGAQGGASFSGASYVVFGKASGFAADLNLSTLGSNGVKINGVAAYDRTGFSVASAGDIDGDGFPDLIIGAFDASANGQRSGASYVVFGAPSNSNHAPLITSNGGGATTTVSVVENNTAVTTVTAIDPDPTSTLNYSILGGADAAKFTINAVTGTLAFANPPDFEKPTDVGADNVYEVIVRASDGAAFDEQAITITVTNVVAAFIGGNGVDKTLLASNDIDAFSGLGATDTVSYALANAGVTANLINPASNTGDATGDTYNSIANLIGSAFNDTLTGDNKNNVLQGGAGADVLQGGDGTDTAVYSGNRMDYSTAQNTNGSIVLTDTRAGSPDGTDTVSGVELFQFADQTVATAVLVNKPPSITSNGGDTTAAASVAENSKAVTTVTATDPDVGQTLAYSIVPVASGGGADAALFAIDATTGALAFLVAPDYEHPTDAGGNNVYDVTVQVSDGLGGVDTQTIAVTVTNVNPETVTGDGGNNTFLASADHEAFFGLGGRDTVSYALAQAGVTANLVNAAKNTGDAAGDTYNSIENLIGSSFNDKLTGDAKANVLEGGPGADQLNGGGGSDTASYKHATSGVTADLGNPSNNTGEAAGDAYQSIQNLLGSHFDDRLVGDNSNNLLKGKDGDDTLIGKAGNDTLIGGLGHDTLNGGPAHDMFVYRSPAEGGDLILDFAVKQDTIGISASGFGGGLVAGHNLVAGVTFIANASPTAPTTDATFLYDTNDHNLFWDTDGSTPGGAAPQLIAHFDTGVALKADDFDIMT